ncbi:MAG: DUF6531 domain-containing protein [Burkholderiaceae bacterium]|nr:DUF6531 domain-containing protein [Burkholderiaceae bacterium]
MGGGDAGAPVPGAGDDAPDAEEPTVPVDGEPHGTRSGESTDTPTTGGDPVELFSGTVYLDEADLAIPNTILPLALVRMYRSGPGFYTPLGWNWDHNHNQFIRELANGDVALWRMTREQRFVFTGAEFEPPRGVFERLERIGGIGQEYDLTAAGGIVLHFERPPGWTDPARTPLRFIRDRHGNRLDYHYDAADHLVRIEDQDGHFIALSYDQCALIVAAEDHAGRRYLYEHDEQTQHLTEVRRPPTTNFPDGTTRCYSYPVGAHPPSVRHNLLAIEDSEGNTYLQNSYDEDPASPSYGRVIAQFYGDYHYQYRYEQLQYVPSDDLFVNLPAAQTEVLNPDFSLETYTFNFRGDLLDRRYRLNKDGTYRIAAWQYEYDAQTNLIRTVAPDGAEQRQVFDFAHADPRMRGARLRSELIAAAGFPAPSRIVWRGEYEPRFQLLTREIDESGGVRRMRYDFDVNPADPANSGKLIELLHPDATLPDGTVQSSTTRYEYNARGQLTATILPDGTRNEFVYGLAGADRGRLVEEVADAVGLAIVVRHAYDPVGFEHETTDGNGAVTARSTNALGQLERLVRPAIGGITAEERYRYDADGHVIRIERPRGAFTGALSDPAGTHLFDEFERDVLGYATATTVSANSAERRRVEYSNDYRGLAERTLMPDGVMLHTSFDERRQPVEERVVGSDGLELTSRNAYDRAGKLVRQIDVAGRETRFVHDGFGRVRMVILPNGAERRLTWGERDLLLSDELVGDDGSGVVRRLAFTEHEWDERGRRVATTVQLFEDNPALASDFTTRFFHDTNDRIERIVDPRGGETRLQYDRLGRIVAETDPMGNDRRFAYDGAGRVIEQHADHVEPGGGTTTISRFFAWDARGRQIEAIEPDGARLLRKYDDRDLAVQVTDRLGVITATEFDTFNVRTRQVHDVGGLAIVQHWIHDVHSRVTHYTDPAGEITQYSYDSVGRLVSQISPSGFATGRSYSSRSLLVRETLASGAELHYTHDAAGRITAITAAAVTPPMQTIAAHQFRYDGRDLVVRATAGPDVVERRYDSRGRLLAETAQGTTLRAAYDDVAGTVQKTWPDGRTEVLSHDLNGRLAAVSQTAAGTLGAGNGPLAEFQTSGPGAIATASFRGGAELRNSFDERKRLTEINLTSPAGLNERISYRYNAGDRRCVEAISGAVPEIRFYEFDARRRLSRARDGFAAAIPAAANQAQHDAAIAAVGAAAAAAIQTESFGYDAADARLSRSAAGAPAEAYAYGPGHRLLSAGAAAYAHGADGAIQSGDGLTYIADALGRITRIANAGGPLLEFDYDAFGRVAALRPEGEPERTFHHLGAFVEQENLGGVAERQATLHPVTGVPIAYHSGAGTHFALVDARFNLLGLLATDGTLAEAYRYAPFGAPRIFDGTGAPLAGSSLGARPLFGGQNYLAVPRLYLSRKRLMDPALGQFLSPDPRGYSDSPALYAYAAQNPVDQIDPNGEVIPFIVAAFVIGGALAGAGYSAYDAYHHPERYEGWGGTARIFGQVFGGAAIGGLAIVGGELVLGAGGAGIFAGGTAAAGTGTTLTAGQTFLLYGASSAVGGGIARGGFNAMFPEYIDPISPGTVAFDFVSGGTLSVAGRALGPMLAPVTSRISAWWRYGLDQGGEAAISGQLGPYPGRIGQWLDRIGIRQGYSSTVSNFDAGGSWFASTDTAAHEGFHAFINRHFPTFKNLSGLPGIGAAARYPEEVIAYAIGHARALRFHGLIHAPLEAFNSLSHFPAGQQQFAKFFWGSFWAAVAGGSLWAINSDSGSGTGSGTGSTPERGVGPLPASRTDAGVAPHPNVKPPGAK